MTQSTTPTESRDSTQTAGDAAQGLTQDLKRDAQDTAESIRDRAVEEVGKRGEQAKAGVADEISNMGDALRRAAEELRDGSPQERTFGQMADALADMSDTVRDKDLGEVAGDVSDFARRNPLAFLGGAALLGFAGTRIARASERHREGSVDLNHMWDSDEGDDELEAAVVGRQPHTPPAAPSPATSSPATAGTAPATGAGVPHGKPGEIK